MNEKEISEIRRRFRPDRSGISHIRGCYVNENREIVSQFDQSLGLMSQEESEKLLAILRRTLSGTLGKNLADITFSTQQVVDSEEHRLLMALRGSSLADEEAVQALFQRVISSLTLEGNYLILLAHDTYDVPYRAKDGERMDDASDQVFSYILCSICPVKLTKPALSYQVQEGVFCTKTADWVVAPPALGFLFPAFDDRSANIYGALYSTLATDENSQRKSMRYIGSCIGRVFYLLDKAGRVAGDKRAGRYNVYLVNGVEDPGAALENARRQSLAAANDLVRAYGMLDVKLNKSLIDNIMILGLRHAVEPLDPENQPVRWELP